MNADLAAQHAMDRCAEVGFEGLTESDRTLATVWQFASGVGNGGFKGYFASSRGDLAFHAPAALHAIHALALATIAADANRLFGPDGPPKNISERRARIDEIAANRTQDLRSLDDRYFACEEDVDELLEKFLQSSDRPHA